MEGEFGESGKDVGRPGPLMMYGVPPPDIRRTDGFECVLLLKINIQLLTWRYRLA